MARVNSPQSLHWFENEYCLTTSQLRDIRTKKTINNILFWTFRLISEEKLTSPRLTLGGNSFFFFLKLQTVIGTEQANGADLQAHKASDVMWCEQAVFRAWARWGLAEWAMIIKQYWLVANWSHGEHSAPAAEAATRHTHTTWPQSTLTLQNQGRGRLHTILDKNSQGAKGSLIRSTDKRMVQLLLYRNKLLTH